MEININRKHTISIDQNQHPSPRGLLRPQKSGLVQVLPEQGLWSEPLVRKGLGREPFLSGSFGGLGIYSIYILLYILLVCTYGRRRAGHV